MKIKKKSHKFLKESSKPKSERFNCFENKLLTEE